MVVLSRSKIQEMALLLEGEGSRGATG